MNLCDDVTTVTTHLTGVRGGARACMCVYARKRNIVILVVTSSREFKLLDFSRHRVVTGSSPGRHAGVVCG